MRLLLNRGMGRHLYIPRLRECMKLLDGICTLFAVVISDFEKGGLFCVLLFLVFWRNYGFKLWPSSAVYFFVQFGSNLE